MRDIFPSNDPNHWTSHVEAVKNPSSKSHDKNLDKEEKRTALQNFLPSNLRNKRPRDMDANEKKNTRD